MWYALVYICIIFIVNGYAEQEGAKFSSIHPIRVAFAIDDFSERDLTILVNSVLLSAHNKQDVVIHILTCGKDELSSHRLQSEVVRKTQQCFPGVRFEIKAFTIPPDSGFGAQLAMPKKRHHHWNSPSGADMARFYLASMFPQAQRVLYLDNDVTVSCCLEEIFHSDLAGKAVGLALDDLKWAGWTQFQRHYNASHPLVIANMRRNYTTYQQSLNPSNEVTKEEFVNLVSRYPNDGVMLIDVARYNTLGILEAMNQIAQANADGEYVVGIGTQQFTVLTLHDRWKEITPRANLRHFPDMARGYMMWFFYNGFLHYAGASKPRSLCQMDTFKNNNWHRVLSFTPWLISHYQMSVQCPVQSFITNTCNRHLLVARNALAMFKVMQTVINTMGNDKNLVYLRFGTNMPSLQLNEYEKDLSVITKAFTSVGQVTSNINSTQLSCHDTEKLDMASMGLVDVVDRMVVFSTVWNIRVFVDNRTTPNNNALTALQEKLRTISPTHTKLTKINLPESSQESSGRRLKASPVRKVDLVQGAWCRKYENSSVYIPQDHLAQVDSDGRACQSVLLHIKENGYKHWEPVVISLHYESNRETISTLLALDLVFMRPKLILVALNTSSGEDAVLVEMDETKSFLLRSGFMSGESVSINCYKGKKLPSIVYVWGVRMNDLEYM